MNNCKKNSCTQKNLQQLAEQLSVIAEPNRLKILCLLSSGRQCVCDIHKPLQIKQNLASHHLKVLLDAGLVTSKKEGLCKYYALENQTIKTLISNLNQIIHA
ncbi:metalloregulator ArsR/SmtB family transcription factor [Patescibacteria group bacterium]|nr:metalloregulator ArsR/SmtB family transcription factor [Patescibacteria group bacterium]